MMTYLGDEKSVNKIIPSVNNLFTNKKGSLSDLIYIMIIFLVVAIVIVVGRTVYFEIGDTNFMANQPAAKNIFDNAEQRVLPLFDIIFLGTVVAGILGTLVLAFMLRTSPLFFWIGALFLMVVVMLSAVFSNVYQEIASVPKFAEATATNATFMTTVLNNLPLFIAVTGATTLVVLYGLSRYQQGAL